MFYARTFRTSHNAVPSDTSEKDLQDWYAKWELLSPTARKAFLTQVKAATRAKRFTTPSIASSALPPTAMQELVRAGFIELTAAKGAARERVTVPDAVLPFSVHIRTLFRQKLTANSETQAILNYCNRPTEKGLVRQRVAEVIRDAGKSTYYTLSDVFFDKYILRARWIDWVCQTLKDPLAEQIMERIGSIDHPLTRPELKALLPEQSPVEVEALVSRLLAYLALMEDVDPISYQIVVGLHPATRADRERSTQKQERPALVVCENPRYTGPNLGLLVDDLRGLLLEIAQEPPRLKVEGELFQKEEGRLIAALPNWPDWLADFLWVQPSERLERALSWASQFRLTDDSMKASENRLRLTKQGTAWLAAPVPEQFAMIYSALNATEKKSGSQYQSANDALFLGSQTAILLADPKNRYPSYWNVPIERRLALRSALRQAFDALKPGEFYHLDSVLGHLSFGENSPLLTGHKPEQVIVICNDRHVDDLEDDLEDASREFLECHIKERLIPLGCMTVGVTDAGEICIARHPRLDAYYERTALTAELVQDAAHSAKVVVQPDFSVIIIGMNPTPAAELAPFCERVKGNAGPGSLTFKITRDSVMNAVTHGLPATEILKRLKKHAANDLPKNVVHEVTEWSTWVREIEVGLLLVLRCPDAETAERVASAFRKKAIRLGDTAIALDKVYLTAADRKALKKYGVVVTEREMDEDADHDDDDEIDGESW